MMTHAQIARRAPLALTATAALLSTAAFAQDAGTADPVIVLPPAQTETVPAQPTVSPVVTPTTIAPASTTAPTPTIVLPEPVVEESAPAPVTAQAATTDSRQARSAPSVATRESTTAPVARASDPPAQASETTIAQVRTPQPESAVDPLGKEMISGEMAASGAPVAAAAPAEPAVSTDNGTNELAIAGVLGALGLAAVGGVALLASRRRRHPAPLAETTPMERTVEPVPATSVAPVTAAPIQSGSIRQSIPKMAPTMAQTQANGDPVPLPSSPPTSYAERDSLLRRLVDAKPDRANPFKSPAARARRARLIIQSLGRNFEDRKPRFDLSQYTHRWPALRGWQPATA